MTSLTSKSNSALFTIPYNFALVENGVYRSAYPCESDIAFLRHLGIRTVVLLSIEFLPSTVRKLLLQEATGEDDSNQRINIIGVSTLKSWGSESMREDFSHMDVMRALEMTVRAEYHPLLLTCPTGELQTSVVVGCLRRHQNRCLTSILSECEMFLSPRCALRSSVISFIESWNPSLFSLHSVLRTEDLSLPSSMDMVSPWYRAVLHLDQQAEATLEGTEDVSSSIFAPLRNPPSLSPFSYFSPKVSLVEEDDD